MSAEVAKYWSKTLHIPHEGDNNLINSCVRLNPAYPKFNISDNILQVSTNLILNKTQFQFPFGVFQHYNELLNSITGKPSVRWGWKHNRWWSCRAVLQCGLILEVSCKCLTSRLSYSNRVFALFLHLFLFLFALPLIYLYGHWVVRA